MAPAHFVALDQPCLPSTVRLCVRVSESGDVASSMGSPSTSTFDSSTSSGPEPRKQESISSPNPDAGPHSAEDGHVLQMLAELLPGVDAMGVMLERPENERPRLFLGASELPISISHTRGIAGIAVSLHPIEHHPSNPTAIGIDIERADRIVAPALLSRMRHPDEELDAMGASAIQLWTLKEAALKWLGTGLRTPMNSVRLTSLQKEGTPEGICLRFKARFSTGNQVELCSFRFMSYWISTAFDVQANP